MNRAQVSRRLFLRLGAGSVLVATSGVPAFLDPAAAATETQRKRVVASFSILGDLVRVVGGERVEVTELVGPDTDMHVFQPSPNEARRLAGADVFVLNGLGLEGWGERLASAAGFAGRQVVASTGITPLSADRHGHGHAHAHGRKGAAHADPHAWHDVANVKTYAANIRDGLIAADPEGRVAYEAAAGRYLDELTALDAEIRAALAPFSRERRRVITTHEAFRYFARAYGVTFLAPQGVSTEAEPSAKEVAALIRQIKAQRATAIFVENISNPRLLERIAKESGAALGGKLFSDALSGPGGEAPNYLALMRANLRALVRAFAKDAS